MKTSKWGKKVLSMLMVLVLLLSLAACTQEGSDDSSDSDSSSTNTENGDAAMDSSEDQIVIGLSLGTLREERWQRELEMFKEAAEAAGAKLLDQSAEDDAQKQMSQCENLISQGVDVLIVQALDSEAAGAIVETAHEAGIKVIAYDRLVRNGDLDYYITFDSYKVGQVEAQFVVDKAPEGNYIWLKGGPEDFNAHEVARGQASVLQPLIDEGKINVVLEQWCKGWDPKEALKHAENGLTLADNDVQAIIASNDGTAGGAIQALAAQGLAGIVPIAGQDADIAACQRIVEGTQTGTVYKPLLLLNKAAMDVAIAVASGKDPLTSIDESLGVWTTLDNGTKMVDSFSVDVIAVDKDNMVEEIIKSGFHSLEDVYKNVPQDQWPEVN